MTRKIRLQLFLFTLVQFLFISYTQAQCSVCTKTAEQLGEKPGKGLNVGILYLMIIPLALAFIIGYRWWKRERNQFSGQ